MANIVNSVKETATKMTSNAKIADLAKNTTTYDGKGLTTDYGVKVSDTDNWLKVSGNGNVGPTLLEDQFGREKTHRFDHERIPERVIHARGAGAHGYFKVFDDRAAKYTSASVLTDSSRTTPVFARFSTVQGSRGSADTVRDVRGFAVKMYTEEGNWDIVGNDIPIFFIQDSMKFPDVIHAVKPEPHNEVPTAQSAHNNFWDYVGLQPESAHMVMWVMSDRGIPRSYRMMQGFGVNTYTLLNAKGERYFVKFHFIPELGVHSFVWDEALKLSGQDPDFHRKDLNEAIENGAPAKWTFAIQTIPEADEHKFEFDILDATKIWPEELVPLQEIGEMVLDKTVDEYFSETEQVAFCTSHVVPGIGFSDDPLLLGRNFSYFDTQISRLGLNWQQLPINRPVCPVMNHQRDGQHQQMIHKSNINYWPNRDSVGAPVAPENGGYYEYPQKVEGIKQRVRGDKFQEHFKQAQLFYNSLAPHEKEHLINAISFELDHCDDERVTKTYATVLNKIDYDLASSILSIVDGQVLDKSAVVDGNPGKKSRLLSQMDFMPKSPTIKSRRIAILIDDGFNGNEVMAIKASISAGGALPFVIASKRVTITAETGPNVKADHHFEGMRSTMFDALIIPSGSHAEKLYQNGRVVHWVREAFGHCKTIGAIGQGIAVVTEALHLPEVRVIDLQSEKGTEVVSSYGVVTTASYNAKAAARDVLDIVSGSDSGFLSNFAYEVSQHRCWAREMDGLTSKVAY